MTIIVTNKLILMQALMFLSIASVMIVVIPSLPAQITSYYGLQLANGPLDTSGFKTIGYVMTAIGFAVGGFSLWLGLENVSVKKEAQP